MGKNHGNKKHKAQPSWTRTRQVPVPKHMEQPAKEFKLDMDSELRFEIEEKDAKVSVMLLNGQAELFGSELLPGKEYRFRGMASLAIFTFHGCVIRLLGGSGTPYISHSTPMVEYINIHQSLEQRRQTAERKNTYGPVLLVTGSVDAGKNTLCQILLNYAARRGRRPLYVDLDVGVDALVMPGSIGMYVVERPADIEKGFAVVPQAFHFGHKAIGSNTVLYKEVMPKVAEVAVAALDKKKKTKSSGIIINTGNWIKGAGYTLLVQIARTFKADVIIVLNQERLYHQFKADISPDVAIVTLSKNGGVMLRSTEVRQDLEHEKMRGYFYGEHDRIHPFSFVVKFDTLKLYKIGARQIPLSCLPLGTKLDINGTELTPVHLGPSLMFHILAVTNVRNSDGDVFSKPIRGFLCVTDVNMKEETLTVLSPQPGPLPSNVLLYSELQFLDCQE